MGEISQNCRNLLLNHVFGVSSWTPPTAHKVALHTGDPGTAGTANETTYTNYARVAINFNAAASGEVVQEASVISFPTCGATGATCTWWSVWSDEGTPKFLGRGTINGGTGIVIASGNTPRIAASQVKLSIGAGTTGDSGIGFSDTYRNKMLDHAFNNTAISPQPTIKIAAFITNCTGSATGTEVTGGSYLREAHSAWTTATTGTLQNSGAITFDTPSAAWSSGSNIVSIGIMDGDTATCIAYGNDITDQPVGTGDTVQFADGALDVALT